MSSTLKRFIEEEEGQTIVEYGLIVSLIALISVVVLNILGKTLKNTFNHTTDALDTSSN